MGDRVDASALDVGHGHEVQRKLQRCVAVLQRMVDGGWFVGHEDTVGMEVELDLVDPLGRPRLINDAVLARLARADMQHELGQFNVELNLAPRQLQGRVLHDSEREFADVLDACRARIEGLGARLVAVGMLPTLSAEQLTLERIPGNPRYALLCRRMRAARHRPFLVRIIDGCEPVEFTTDSVAPEAAATSLQLHLRVPPDRFAAYYNAAQMIAGAQVAVAANSPYLLARQAWQETRITLLEQLLDTRRSREVRAGAPARVRLGYRGSTTPSSFRRPRAAVSAAVSDGRGRRSRCRAWGRVCSGPAGASAAQRDGVALEPTGLRRPGRAPTVADREPGTAQRTDRRRHGRQRRLLLRTASGDRRQRPCPMEPDTVRGSRAGPAPRGTRWAGGAAVLAGNRLPRRPAHP